jgi:hypothetical protein
MGMDDEPFGSCANEVKWVAGDERDGRRGGRGKDGDILGSNDLQPVDLVAGEARRGLNPDLVSGMNVLQGTKISIAMPCDSNISRLSGERCAGDMSSAHFQRLLRGSLKNGHCHAQARDFHTAQNIAFLCRGRRAYLARFLRLDLVFESAICGLLTTSSH